MSRCDCRQAAIGHGRGSLRLHQSDEEETLTLLARSQHATTSSRGAMSSFIISGHQCPVSTVNQCDSVSVPESCDLFMSRVAHAGLRRKPPGHAASPRTCGPQRERQRERQTATLAHALAAL